MMLVTVQLILSLVMTFNGSDATFYDDFSDGDIGDWEERCLPGSWWATTGAVHGATANTCSAIVPPGDINMWNCSVTISGYGVRTLGIVARLNSEDTGIYAYVSPDSDVARIRLTTSNGTSTIYSSIGAEFPSNEIYELTLTCEDSLLQLDIFIPSTSQFWSFGAVDPSPQSGQFGLAMGDEPHAFWQWISVDGTTGIEEEGSSPVSEPDLRIWPNPFFGSLTFTVSGMDDGPLSVEVYDLSGRLLASPEFEVGGSERSLLWDGRCSDGSMLPAGVYITRLSGADGFVRPLVKL